LPGSTGIKVVFGMLSRGENGKLCIEDIHQSVPIKIESMVATDDMITESMFILAKGEMIDEVFNVYQMTLPPVPSRSLCEASMNLFGGPTELTEDLVISTIGLSPEDASIAVLSNVVLDNPETIEKLNLLFTGFEECDAVPQAFVFMGNFSSAPFNPFSGDSLRSFQRSFDQLGQLLARHPVTLEKARIILVPGLTEPGYGLYPQPALPDALARGLSSRFPNVTLASNPCRVRFYNRQITFFSGENMQRLRRGTLIAVQDRDSGKEADMLVRCIMSQMHLLPGTARNHAAVWEFDASLRIYPPPHALFLSDARSNSFEKSVDSDTVLVSMPSFSSASMATGEFHLYSPSSNETSLSSV
jgi:DNA polymerase epsilon subunit 2